MPVIASILYTPMSKQQLRPKRSLGQNFLHDQNIARKIVKHFDPKKEETILEIGPGTGILSGFLAPLCERLILIEKDSRAVKLLQQKFLSDNRVLIVHEDILECDLKRFRESERKLRLIGNIPYNITSPILNHVFGYRSHIRDMILMLQLEAARRITAGPSSPDYGILSVLAQTWTSVSILFKVPGTVFYPEPDVTSAVVYFNFDDKHTGISNYELYETLVRKTFGQRRKMLRSSLKYIAPEINLKPELFSVDLNKRPEDCTVNEFINITNELNHVLTK